MKKSTIILLICIGIVIALIFAVGSSLINSYNEMVSGQEGGRKIISRFKYNVTKKSGFSTKFS